MWQEPHKGAQKEAVARVLCQVGWVTGRLVNGELPRDGAKSSFLDSFAKRQELTADVFYELYNQKLDPNNLSPIDVGSLIMNYTIKANAENTVKAAACLKLSGLSSLLSKTKVDMMADTTFFAKDTSTCL